MLVSWQSAFPSGTGTLSAAAVAAFTVTADGVERLITDIVLSTLNDSLLDVTLSTPIYKDQVVVVSYDSAAGLVDKDGNKYQSFTSGEDGVPAAANNSTVVASTDATLSDLVVNDGNADLTLTPTFASGMYTYTAIGGEHRRRGDGDADEERFRGDDRISGRGATRRSPTPTPRIPAIRWRWRRATPSSR